MNQIEFNNVWKKFRRGERFNSLRDAIPYLFSKTFSKNNNNRLKQEEFWALQDLSFEVKKGEVVGIIGPNGAGKSTILKLLSKIIEPNRGKIKISGRIGALIEITAGFHPDLTGRENVYLNGTILGMTKKEIDNKFEQIVDFSGIVEFIDTPVKRYSSGMYSRLGFSVAAHMDPDVLLVDEVLSVGDTAFQAKCTQKMRELLESNITIVLVSHNLSLIQILCNRAILLQKGRIIKEGIPNTIIPYYQNIVYKDQEEELKKQIITDDYKVKIKHESPVNIIKISLYDVNQNFVEQFKPGESIFVNVEFESKQEIDNPVFSLDIIRPDGVLCCSSNSKDNKFSIDNMKGKGSISINLDKINLAPGIYSIKVSIWDKDMLHTYATGRKDIFRIESKEVMSNNAIFLPEVKWKFK
jgi:lipopolysaccharide transport system ATP-binding protein